MIHEDDLPDSDVRGFEGFRVTTPLRTLLDVAAANTSRRSSIGLSLTHCEKASCPGDSYYVVLTSSGPSAALLIERALNAAARS